MGAAFTFRAGAGFPGEVTRQENSIILPCVIDAAAPPLFYGCPVAVDTTTNGVRPIVSPDTVANLYGILVRPFPTSQASTTNFGNTPLGGAGVPPTSGPCSVLISGWINVQVPAGQTLTTKNGIVYIWTAASSGVHILSGFEAVTPGGSGIQISGTGIGLTTSYNGAQDANGVIELQFNV
jgi:hypothetical protein